MNIKKEIEKELQIIIIMIKNKEKGIKIEEHRKNIDKLLQEYLKDL